MKRIVVQADDSITRYASVYLGPPGKTLWWHVRYTAYLFGGLLFAGILVTEAILPFVRVGVPPSWEFAITILVTSLVMAAVDYDKPPLAVVANVFTVQRVRYHPAPTPTLTTPQMRDVKITREPLNV